MSSRPDCRLCGGEFYSQSLLNYPNSPWSAQGFLDDIEGVDDVVDLKIYQCRCCGLVQHGLPPVSYYKDVIRAIAFSSEMGEFRIAQLGRWISENSLSDKRILEIGCGKGEYLDLLKGAGANLVFGLENSVSSVEIARSRGLNAQQGYLTSDFRNPWDGKFDAFAIFSFMEHWPDINSSLRKLCKLLNDGAVGLVEVPNFEFIIENGMYSEFTTDHILYFDRVTLKNALEFNGFEVLSIDSIWHNYILSAQVRKRTPLRTSGFVSKQGKIVDELHRYVEKFQKEDVVVWGAGHQALAVLSLAGLQDKVSHVIDSADFKQGKYTPGTHLYIKSPDSLKEDRPRAIIVMAAAYSDEVAAQIKNRYPEVDCIAILREEGLEEVLVGT